KDYLIAFSKVIDRLFVHGYSVFRVQIWQARSAPTNEKKFYQATMHVSNLDNLDFDMLRM
ncbi:MAG: hypothetical protein K2W95_33235, partial [Candidatus Obscuribacterales bacterium]|nr:hypothetical protein [Candidatus Obscuribacterales bacterium]